MCTKTSKIGLRFGGVTIIRISSQYSFTRGASHGLRGYDLCWALYHILKQFLQYCGSVQRLDFLVKVTPRDAHLKWFCFKRKERLLKDVFIQKVQRGQWKIYDINRFNDAFINIYKKYKMLVTLGMTTISFLTPVSWWIF